MTKVLVCGGRDYKDKSYVFGVLDGINTFRPITKIIHGAAKGADTLGDLWAWSRSVTVQSYPAQWNTLGKSAGPLRNREMYNKELPDIVVVFPGGKGTEDMFNVAKDHGGATIVDCRHVSNEVEGYD